MDFVSLGKYVLETYTLNLPQMMAGQQDWTGTKYNGHVQNMWWNDDIWQNRQTYRLMAYRLIVTDRLACEPACWISHWPSSASETWAMQQHTQGTVSPSWCSPSCPHPTLHWQHSTHTHHIEPHNNYQQHFNNWLQSSWSRHWTEIKWLQVPLPAILLSCTTLHKSFTCAFVPLTYFWRTKLHKCIHIYLLFICVCVMVIQVNIWQNCLFCVSSTLHTHSQFRAEDTIHTDCNNVHLSQRLHKKNICECCTYVHKMDWSSRSKQKYTQKYSFFCNSISHQKRTGWRFHYEASVWWWHITAKCSSHFMQSSMYCDTYNSTIEQ